ncbi:MAG: hypothetical protein F9K34_17360 [Albidovulum sp.]|jgi:hypothetical protein|uniref:DUF3303 family protein n=1 Tax=Albidovulum sp. TaxID=1872424 RepID=UPI00132618A4|nr:DUF3303 family protein [Defluviimonas sp.]KAB2879236.1 MAG: hypothetical protein F9K34_17360 [Defluviimonas sp.]
MQLICEIDTGGFDAWKSGFDDRSEARDQAGLTMLQMWHDADEGARAVVLFEVRDRARAEDWVRTEGALHAPVSARFLRTA